MKKSIVLLISLFFISTLSILIIYNLEETNKFITQSHDKLSKKQSVLLMNNLQKEVSSKIKENKNSVLDTIDKGLIENINLSIENMQIIFSLIPYDKVNLNDLIVENKKIVQETSSILNSYEIYNIDFLKSRIKINNIKTTKQLQFLIKAYAKENADETIYKMKSLLGFLDNKNSYELKIGLDNNISSYYIINDKGEVKYFEYSIN